MEGKGNKEKLNSASPRHRVWDIAASNMCCCLTMNRKGQGSCIQRDCSDTERTGLQHTERTTSSGAHGDTAKARTTCCKAEETQKLSTRWWPLNGGPERRLLCNYPGNTVRQAARVQSNLTLFSKCAIMLDAIKKDATIWNWVKITHYSMTLERLFQNVAWLRFREILALWPGT